MDEKLKEYVDRFGQNFPVFFFRNKSEAEITRIIDDCLQQNRPFQAEDNGEMDI